MTRPELIDILARYRRPGSPNFGRHFLKLPGEVVRKEHIPLLLDLLWDDALPPLVREHAAGALGEIGDPRASEPLIDALVEKPIQRGVSTALGRMKVQAAAPVLRELAPRVPAARWALTQLQVSGDTESILADLSSGHLRYIRPRIENLAPEQARAVSTEVCRQLRDIVEADALDVSHCWLLTASQYLPPSSQISETLTASLSQTIDCPGEDIGLRARLLRSLSAVRPLQAISPLIDLICQIDHPGHQQLAAVCVEKILKEHGEEALQLLHKRREDLSRVLNDLKHQRATVRAFEPEKPWHHPPGSPGWFAEVERAIKALKRLLQ